LSGCERTFLSTSLALLILKGITYDTVGKL